MSNDMKTIMENWRGNLSEVDTSPEATLARIGQNRAKVAAEEEEEEKKKAQDKKDSAFAQAVAAAMGNKGGKVFPGTAQGEKDVLDRAEGDGGIGKALSVILNNPDVLDTISSIVKIGAVGAILFPELGSTAGGLVALKGSAAFDTLAAIGYFNKGKNISGWSSVVAAVLSVPAGAVFQIYKSFMLLKNSGSLVLISKEAPAALVNGLSVAIEVIIKVIEEGLNKLYDPNSIISSAIAKKKKDKPESVDEKKIKNNMETSGRELIETLTNIKSELDKG